jgi:hypothetical protein
MLAACSSSSSSCHVAAVGAVAATIRCHRVAHLQQLRKWGVYHPAAFVTAVL